MMVLVLNMTTCYWNCPRALPVPLDQFDLTPFDVHAASSPAYCVSRQPCAREESLAVQPVALQSHARCHQPVE
jgi:hypothetical protein